MNTQQNTANPYNKIHSTKVMVLKTNLIGRYEVQQAAPLLDAIPEILEWSVDTEDIDKVLRIETREWCIHEVITTLTQAGYFCEELMD